jgi:ribulose-phosphate 3-epimerase
VVVHHVEVDEIGAGGRDGAHFLAKAGADTFVAGSAIVGAKDYAATIREMRARLAVI